MEKLSLPGGKSVKVLRCHSRKHPAPGNLGQLIEMVNLLPRDDLANSRSEDLAKYANEKGESFHELMQQITERLPEKLRAFVGVYPADVEDPAVQSLAKKSPYVSDRGKTNLLQLLQIRIETTKRHDLIVTGKKILHEIAHSRLSPSMDLSAHLPQALIVDDKGRLALQQTLLSSCLVGVEVERIRECPMCKRIYWASRIDQPACSTRCNNRRRSQIHRGKH